MFVSKGEIGVIKIDIGVHDTTIYFQDKQLNITLEDISVSSLLCTKECFVLILDNPKYNLFSWQFPHHKYISHEITFHCLSLDNGQVIKIKMLFAFNNVEYKKFLPDEV